MIHIFLCLNLMGLCSLVAGMATCFTTFFFTSGFSNFSSFSIKREGQLPAFFDRKHISTVSICNLFCLNFICVQDITEWEDDTDEYMRKNLPCELVRT